MRKLAPQKAKLSSGRLASPKPIQGEPLISRRTGIELGYEEYLRETTVPEGQSAPVLSGPELAQIRERHKAHIVFESQ